MPADQDAKGSDPIAEHKRRARWRLFGAIIIVGAVAAVAPILLEDQARPLSKDLLIEISPRASAPPPEAKPAPGPAIALDSKPVSPPEPKPLLEPKAAQEELAKKTAPSSVELPKLQKPAKAAADSGKKAQGFMVQVGAYGTVEAANRVKARLEGAGHRVTINTIKTAEGAERHRVRIGPFETRDQALEVRDRAKAQGYDAAVVAAS